MPGTLERLSSNRLGSSGVGVRALSLSRTASAEAPPPPVSPAAPTQTRLRKLQTAALTGACLLALAVFLSLSTLLTLPPHGPALPSPRLENSHSFSSLPEAITSQVRLRGKALFGDRLASRDSAGGSSGAQRASLHIEAASQGSILSKLFAGASSYLSASGNGVGPFLGPRKASSNARAPLLGASQGGLSRGLPSDMEQLFWWLQTVDLLLSSRSSDPGRAPSGGVQLGGPTAKSTKSLRAAVDGDGRHNTTASSGSSDSETFGLNKEFQALSHIPDFQFPPLRAAGLALLDSALTCWDAAAPSLLGAVENPQSRRGGSAFGHSDPGHQLDQRLAADASNRLVTSLLRLHAALLHNPGQGDGTRRLSQPASQATNNSTVSTGTAPSSFTRRLAAAAIQSCLTLLPAGTADQPLAEALAQQVRNARLVAQTQTVTTTSSTTKDSDTVTVGAAVAAVMASAVRSFHASREARGALEYTHLSKTGGTSVCMAARANSCRNPYANLEDNCIDDAFPEDRSHWLITDDPRIAQPGPAKSSIGLLAGMDQIKWLFQPAGACDVAAGAIGRDRGKPPVSADENNGRGAGSAGGDGSTEDGSGTTYVDFLGADQSAEVCAARKRRLAAGSFYGPGGNMLANEGGVHGGGRARSAGFTCGREFVTLLTLRRPDTQLASHVNHVLSTMQKSFNWLEGLGVPIAADISPAAPELWRLTAPAILDNYFTRSLAGRHAGCLPLYGLDPSPTTGHLAMALSNLAAHDVVLLLEEPEQAAAAAKAALNWDAAPFGQKRRSANYTILAAATNAADKGSTGKSKGAAGSTISGLGSRSGGSNAVGDMWRKQEAAGAAAAAIVSSHRLRRRMLNAPDADAGSGAHQGFDGITSSGASSGCPATPDRYLRMSSLQPQGAKAAAAPAPPLTAETPIDDTAPSGSGSDSSGSLKCLLQDPSLRSLDWTVYRFGAVMQRLDLMMFTGAGMPAGLAGHWRRQQQQQLHVLGANSASSTGAGAQQAKKATAAKSADVLTSSAIATTAHQQGGQQCSSTCVDLGEPGEGAARFFRGKRLSAEEAYEDELFNTAHAACKCSCGFTGQNWYRY